MTRIILAAIVLLCAQVAPPRDPARPSPSPGPGTIKGRVRIITTRQPARNALVTLRATAGRGSQTRTTGADGTFVFEAVEPGRYTLSASKDAYLRTELGKQRPDDRGTPIDVSAGQTLTNIDLALWKGSVLTGRITDAFGEPVEHVAVSVMNRTRRLVLLDGVRVWGTDATDLVAAASARATEIALSAATNDLGEFRVFGLAPGDYLVSATPGASTPFSRAQSVGGIAPTYYPGSILPHEARLVRLALEQELGGIDMILQAVRTIRLTGVATTSTNQPVAFGTIALERVEAQNVVKSPGARTLGQHGDFEMTSVTPGDYVATVLERTSDDVPSPPEVAQWTVRVMGEDITGLEVSTRPGVTVWGRVRFEDGAGRGIAGGGLVAQSPGGERLKTTRFDLREDSSFELRGVFGRRVLSWPNPPSGWAVQELRIAGRDIRNLPIEFTPGSAPVGPVEVLFSRR